VTSLTDHVGDGGEGCNIEDIEQLTVKLAGLGKMSLGQNQLLLELHRVS
jgi:hypothetical protein